MNTHRNRKHLAKPSLLLALGAALCVAQPVAFAVTQPLNRALGWDSDQMVTFQYAATHGDRSHVAEMIGKLQTPQPLDYTMTVLHSLALLGATEALPTIDKFISTTHDTDLATYAKVARARLIAEDAARSLSGPAARAAGKVRRFYRELGLTPEEINAAAVAFQSDRAANQYTMDYAPKVTVPLDALLELVDVVYQSGDYRAYAALPEVSRLDFAAFPETALKVRLAPLSRAQRITTLVQEVTHSNSPPGQGSYELQLLADEGDAARSAVLAQLRSLDAQDAQAHAGVAQGANTMPNNGVGTGTLGHRELERVLEISGGPPNAVPATTPTPTGVQPQASLAQPRQPSRPARWPQRVLVVAY